MDGIMQNGAGSASRWNFRLSVSFGLDSSEQEAASEEAASVVFRSMTWRSGCNAA